MAGPLAHLRVLDLSRVLAGPWATQLLADLGAEVIKVERPVQGDDTRWWGPPFVQEPDHETAGMAAYFTAANRGKKSLSSDFTEDSNCKIIKELVKECDVLVENFKVGSLSRYGLDYPALSVLKPDLVYCSVTGFGQTGPYAQRAGYDALAQAMGGLMSITGEPDGEPMRAGVAVVDLFTGLYAAVGILAALAHRDRTGEGQHIDLALLDVGVAMLANQAANYFALGKAPARMGNPHPNIVPYQLFAAADGDLFLAVGNDQQFARFCAVAGLAGLATDPDFATNRARVAHRERLIPQLAAVLRGRSRGDWTVALAAVGVPCGPVNSLDQVFDDPHVVAKGLRRDTRLGDGTTVSTVANPLVFSRTPADSDGAPPGLGQHSAEILAWLKSRIE